MNQIFRYRVPFSKKDGANKAIMIDNICIMMFDSVRIRTYKTYDEGVEFYLESNVKPNKEFNENDCNYIVDDYFNYFILMLEYADTLKLNISKELKEDKVKYLTDIRYYLMLRFIDGEFKNISVKDFEKFKKEQKEIHEL